MNTQEAQTIINNIKDVNDPKYKEAKAFLDNQQVEGKKEEPKKSSKEKAKAVKDKLKCNRQKRGYFRSLGRKSKRP